MSLFSLIASIFLFNLMTFGNGPVMIPLLQVHLVNEHGVLTQEQLLYAFTIARVTPGQANFYVAAIGYMLFGWTGAILTTLVIMLPSYLMLPLLSGYGHLSDSRRVKGFTRGLTTASIGLIFAAVVEIARSTLAEPLAWVIFALALVMVQLLKWNPILSLLIASALGVLLKVT